jgi:hypothetical protein
MDQGMKNLLVSFRAGIVPCCDISWTVADWDEDEAPRYQFLGNSCDTAAWDSSGGGFQWKDSASGRVLHEWSNLSYIFIRRATGPWMRIGGPLPRREDHRWTVYEALEAAGLLRGRLLTYF